jgi:hypothetical protein
VYSKNKDALTAAFAEGEPRKISAMERPRKVPVIIAGSELTTDVAAKTDWMRRTFS